MSGHWIAQSWIVCWSLAGALLMTGTTNKQRFFGCLCGFISQPAWFYAVITAEQWGQFGMACVYTIMWVRGMVNNWDWIYGRIHR